MTERFQNKYRSRSARCPNWDYSSNAAYFVTICTQNREKYFGEIVDHKMQLSHVGIIADILWHEIKTHAKNVELDAFVVMPDHIHGILILNGENNNGYVNGSDDASVVGTLHATSLQKNATSLQKNATPLQPQPQQPTPQNEFMANISPKPGSVSTIIRSYKSAVTKHAHRLGFEFAWQSRFHDHIIHDDKSFERIRDYIINNPAQWGGEKIAPE